MVRYGEEFPTRAGGGEHWQRWEIDARGHRMPNKPSARSALGPTSLSVRQTRTWHHMLRSCLPCSCIAILTNIRSSASDGSVHSCLTCCFHGRTKMAIEEASSVAARSVLPRRVSLQFLSHLSNIQQESPFYTSRRRYHGIMHTDTTPDTFGYIFLSTPKPTQIHSTRSHLKWPAQPDCHSP